MLTMTVGIRRMTMTSKISKKPSKKTSKKIAKKTMVAKKAVKKVSKITNKHIPQHKSRTVKTVQSHIGSPLKSAFSKTEWRETLKLATKKIKVLKTSRKLKEKLEVIDDITHSAHNGKPLDEHIVNSLRK